MKKSVSNGSQGPLPGNGPWGRVDGVWYTKDEADEWVPMKADISLPTKSTLRKSVRATTAKAARSTEQGPLPGKGPWVRLDGVWYTKDEADEWVKMPGQEHLKPKRARKARV